MKEYALITGASKGIGKSIATILAQRGYNVLLVARSANELQGLGVFLSDNYQTEVHCLAIDLSEKESAEKVINWVNSLAVPLSILVNNAGYGIFSRFSESDLAVQQNMLNLNINAVVALTHHLLPLLKKNKPAYILNVASTAAYQAVPSLAVYAASKAFVLSYSRALAYELKATGISVSCLCPGPTDTNFAQRAGMDDLTELAEKFNMQPDEVAEIGINGMFNKKAEIIPGFLNKAGAAGAKLLNKSFVERIGARLYKL